MTTLSSILAWLLGLDPRLMLAVQLWRVVGAAFLFGLSAGDLNPSFAIPAGIGDIATGIAAFLLLRLVLQGTHTRRHVVWFTALGVGDFVVAVVTGVVTEPAGLDTLPWVLFPSVAVPFFLFVHVLNWMQLQPTSPTAAAQAETRYRVGSTR